MELGVLSPDRTGSSAERQEIALRFVNHTPQKHPQMTPSACPFYWSSQTVANARGHREAYGQGGGRREPRGVSGWVPALFHQ